MPEVMEKMEEKRGFSIIGGVEDPSEQIFALDIGTRSVIGLVGVPEDDLFRVLAVEVEPHVKRAVVDGQIEDIEQTARVAARVKQRLEETLGHTLEKVHIAAAGRVLKTQKSSYEVAINEREIIQEQQIFELESGAIQSAYQSLFNGDEEEGAYYCVGYSVIHYYLDDYEISTLLGHRGKSARVELIATFLPNEVVESLYSTMSRIKLSVASLTLEPIAAMNAVIPSDLRRLNLALVDIGAGTSDIAISDGGSVTAYTMATVAGDEITEAIMQACLVDFKTAEDLKQQLGGTSATISYQNILGMTFEESAQDLLQKVKPAIENLCAIICERILDVNGQPPAAIFLVGGGSQTPMMCDMISRRLGIDPNRVAVGGSNYISRIAKSEVNISGPEYATPVGIAITAQLSRVQEGCVITLNGTKYRMMKDATVTVIEALLMAGWKYSQIMGRPGRAITYELNGEKKVVRGALPQHAEISVNGRPAGISAPVRTGDEVTAQPAQPGEDAGPTLGDVVQKMDSFQILLNGVHFTAGRVVYVNNERTSDPSRPIHEMDTIYTYEIATLEDLCRETRLSAETLMFYIGGERKGLEYKLNPGDEIQYFLVPGQEWEEPVAADFARQPEGNIEETADSGPEIVPEEGKEEFETGAAEDVLITPPPVIEPQEAEGMETEPQPEQLIDSLEIPKAPEPAAFLGGMQAEPTSLADESLPLSPAPPQEPNPIYDESAQTPRVMSSSSGEISASNKMIRVQVNGEWVELYPKEDRTPYLFVDMLNLVEIDPSKPQGDIVLLLNDHTASYLDPLRDGDRVEIRWEKRA